MKYTRKYNYVKKKHNTSKFLKRKKNGGTRKSRERKRLTRRKSVKSNARNFADKARKERRNRTRKLQKARRQGLFDVARQKYILPDSSSELNMSDSDISHSDSDSGPVITDADLAVFAREELENINSIKLERDQIQSAFLQLKQQQMDAQKEFNKVRKEYNAQKKLRDSKPLLERQFEASRQRVTKQSDHVPTSKQTSRVKRQNAELIKLRDQIDDANDDTKFQILQRELSRVENNLALANQSFQQASSELERVESKLQKAISEAIYL
uniref:Uncharacterized protein n=1 Tax=viral metagenome TaxID=1070528 RepID=A0A6C0AYA1_9ZZZZ|tara:strand:- start:281 stop:1084 length:804 start_codon:yes stop_codon:yes gene_type:complete